MVIRSLTVGTDGSEASRDALAWSAGMADVIGAPVRALSAWQVPLLASMSPVVGEVPSDEFFEDQARSELQKVVDDAGASVAITQIVREGSAGPVLVEESARDDLLVVGRTGRGRRHGLVRLAEVVLGSTARYCVHHARCPVATVPHGARWVARPTVIVGVDGSDCSIGALRWAIDNLGAHVDLQALWALPYWSEGLIAMDTELFRHAQQTAGGELADAIDAASGGDPKKRELVSSRVEPGTPRRILTAPDVGMDVVVVGDRGRTSVAARVLGSVADHVVRHAHCPVIVVPT